MAKVKLYELKFMETKLDRNRNYIILDSPGRADPNTKNQAL